MHGRTRRPPLLHTPTASSHSHPHHHTPCTTYRFTLPLILNDFPPPQSQHLSKVYPQNSHRESLSLQVAAAHTPTIAPATPVNTAMTPFQNAFSIYTSAKNFPKTKTKRNLSSCSGNSNSTKTSPSSRHRKWNAPTTNPPSSPTTTLTAWWKPPRKAGDTSFVILSLLFPDLNDADRKFHKTICIPSQPLRAIQNVGR